MEQKLILADCDGVLLQYEQGLRNWMEARGYRYFPANKNSYRLVDYYPDVEKKKLKKLVEEFAESPEMKHLEPLRDAKHYVELFRELGYRFFVITSVGDSITTMHYRTQNLIDVFGDAIHDVVCLPVHSSKKFILEKFKGTGYYWIEDHYENAKDGLEFDLKPLLMDHSYNRHYECQFPRVHNWSEIWKEISSPVQISW